MARVEAFDTPMLIRHAFYLVIPLGSWIAGALVERLVEASLGGGV